MHETPHACALSGFPPGAGARVVAQHIRGDHAAVYIATQPPHDQASWLSVMRRRENGWCEFAGGDGGLIWLLTGDEDEGEEEVGVLGLALPVPAAGTYEVACPGEAVTVRTQTRHLAAVLLGVSAECVPVVRRVGD